MKRRLSPVRLFQRLLHIHIENKGLKALALLIAIMLFIVSRQPISDVRLSGVPLEFRGLSPGIEISGDVTQTVSVRLRGSSDIVRSLTPNQISVVANLNDLSNKAPGEHRIQLRPEDVSRPDSVDVQQIDPASIRLRLEKTVSRRVEIKAALMGQVPEGTEIYNVGLEPSTVEIEGPKSLVDKVNFVSTEAVNLSGRKSFRLAVDVETPHNSLRVKMPAAIYLTVEVGEQRGERIFTKVPVNWPDQIAGARLLTKTVDVELYGPRSVLEAVSPADLRVELETAGLRPDAETAKPKVGLPAFKDKHIIVKHITPEEVRWKRQ